MTAKRSMWDESRAKSKYHFDPTRLDPEWDKVIELGKLANTWQDDLPSIISTATPAMWENRGYKKVGAAGPTEELAAEEHDLERAGYDPKTVITHLNWTIPESLQRISDLFAMEDTMNRIHVQMPGEVWNLHIDRLGKWAPEQHDNVMRIFIQLTDWRPGQFWEYGTFHHNRWSAGDVVTFDWQNLPHCTANAGYDPRVTFQITGVVTEQTRKFIKVLRDTSNYDHNSK